MQEPAITPDLIESHGLSSDVLQQVGLYSCVPGADVGWSLDQTAPLVLQVIGLKQGKRYTGESMAFSIGCALGQVKQKYIHSSHKLPNT